MVLDVHLEVDWMTGSFSFVVIHKVLLEEDSLFGLGQLLGWPFAVLDVLDEGSRKERKNPARGRWRCQIWGAALTPMRGAGCPDGSFCWLL